MKKIFALVISVLLVMSALSAGFASTVTNQTEHTYNVYQIFSGTQASDAGNTALGDVEWGTGINGSAFLTALQGDDRFVVGDPAANIFAGITSSETKAAEKVAKALADNNNEAIAKAFANVAAANLTSTVIATVAGNAVSSDLPAGYYLFVDSSNIGEGDAANTALLQITNQSAGLTIAKKYDVPTLDKDITGVNSTDLSSAPIEATDVNIGDTVTYQLTGTLPENYADYENYYYKFTDTLTKGQAVAANAIHVYLVNGETKTDVTAKFAIDPTTAIPGTADSTTITITNSNLKDATNGISGVTATSKIVVEYNVTITADAVIGGTGNRNTGKLTYSNNPNNTGDGNPTSDTPEDYTLVFTYDLKPTKVDKAEPTKKLPGAQFVLKATNGDHAGKWVQIDAATKKLTGWLDTEPTALDTVPTSGDTGVLVSNSTGDFEVYGLDAGTYELKEIKAPQGYNLLTETIAIEITATITGDDTSTHNSDTPALDTLKIKVGEHQNETDYSSTGILPATVENGQGSTLPTTGGMGTTILYVAGSILVLAAGILLVTKRRMNAED